MEPGVDDERHGDDLTVAKGWLGTALAPFTVVAFKRLIGIIDQDKPDRPDIQPAGIRDKISATGHWGTSFRGCATRRMPQWPVMVKFYNPELEYVSRFWRR